MTVLHCLGIDPSLTSTGWAVVRYDGREFTLLSSGRVKTLPATPMAARLAAIPRGIKAGAHGMGIDCVGMEKMFSNPGFPQSGMALAMVRGALLAWLHDTDLPLDCDLAPAEIKKAVALTGKATKGRMIAVTQSLLRLDTPLPEDEADAAAVAICRAIRFWRTLP